MSYVPMKTIQPKYDKVDIFAVNALTDFLLDKGNDLIEVDPEDPFNDLPYFKFKGIKIPFKEDLKSLDFNKLELSDCKDYFDGACLCSYLFNYCKFMNHNICEGTNCPYKQAYKLLFEKEYLNK